MFFPDNHLACGTDETKPNTTKQKCTSTSKDAITWNEHIKLSQVWLHCTMSGLETHWAYAYRPSANCGIKIIKLIFFALLWEHGG